MTSKVVQEMSNGYLLTATASILLPSMVHFDLQHCIGNALRPASHVAQGSLNFSGSESFNFSFSFDDELQPSVLYC